MVEPHAMVTLHGLWYLIAHDPDRDAWRTFRVDRIDRPLATHRRFTRRELPAPDPATYLNRSFATGRYEHTATITVALPAETVRRRLFTHLRGEVVDHGDRCVITLSADSLDVVLQYVAMIATLGAHFTIDGSPEVLAGLRNLSTTLTAALH